MTKNTPLHDFYLPGDCGKEIEIEPSYWNLRLSKMLNCQNFTQMCQKFHAETSSAEKSLCRNVQCWKIPVPKCPPCRNVRVPKCPRQKISDLKCAEKTVPKRQVPKCPRAEISVVPKLPCAETSVVPKRPCAEMSPVPKCPCAEIALCRNVHVSKCPRCRNVHVPKRPRSRNVCAEMSIAEMLGAEMSPRLTYHAIIKKVLKKRIIVHCNGAVELQCTFYSGFTAVPLCSLFIDLQC
mgnify:CR=1 FL=1